MVRKRGLSVRLKLTLSYAGFLMLVSIAMMVAVWLFLLSDLPDVQQTPFTGLQVRSQLAFKYLKGASLMLLVLLVVGFVGGWYLAGRVLAPLDRLVEATRLAGRGSLSHRVSLPGRDDEFRQLADAFDTMLGRLEAHVGEQRRFAANASHELRTPLAVTKSLLDVARAEPGRDTGELIDRLSTVNSRAIDLTEALLLMSRAEQRSFTTREVDLSLMAEEATESLLPLAEKSGVALETGGDFAPTTGSPALLLQLAINLVHNAIVHNLPHGGTVRVTARARADSAVLTVENTGEQVSPELAATLTEPFQRGTERVHTDQAGAGLGLAIANAITHAHDGTLTLTPRDSGGLRISVELPARTLPASGRGSGDRGRRGL